MFISLNSARSFFASLTVAALLAVSAQAGVTVIDFDHDANGAPLTVPGSFANAPSLTTLYAPLGVTFSGPGIPTAQGGAILNAKAGNFFAPPHSGGNYLSFDTNTNTNGPEVITFAQPASNVSIYATAPSPATFTMSGYNSAGVLIATSTGSVFPYSVGNTYVFPYTQLSVNSSALGGISKVVLTASFASPFFVIYNFDDLSFTVNNPTALISGALHLDGIATNAPLQPFTFELRPLDGSVPPAVQTVMVGSNGAFSLTPVVQKNYTLHVKGPHYLATNVNVNASSGDVSGVTASLNAGDINGDNAVDSSDFGLLIGAYGDTYNPVSPTAPASDVEADLNSDGSVDSTDFGLLIGSYGQIGAN